MKKTRMQKNIAKVTDFRRKYTTYVLTMWLAQNFLEFIATENLRVKTTTSSYSSRTLMINIITRFMRNVLPLYHFIWINKHWAFAEVYVNAPQVFKNMVHAFKLSLSLSYARQQWETKPAGWTYFCSSVRPYCTKKKELFVMKKTDI